MLNKKIIALAAVACIGAGGVIMAIGYTLGGHPGYYFDSEGLHAAGSYENKEAYVQEKIKIDEFSSMSIKLDYADLEVIPSDGYYLEYTIDGSNPKPEWDVKNAKLTFNERETKGFGNFMVFGKSYEDDSYDNYNVKVYVPKDKMLTNVKINSDDGDVVLPDINAKYLLTRCDYGDLSIKSLKGGRWDAEMDDGGLKAGSVEVQKMVLTNDYGDCSFDQIKGETAKITMDDGDLKIKSLDASDLQVKNDYGDVNITTADSWEKYDMDLYTDYGRIQLPDGNGYYHRNDDEERYSVNKGNDKKISVDCDDGDIQIADGKK